MSSLDSQDQFGFEQAKPGNILDRLIWRSHQEQVGDGSAYRTAIVQRRELRFLPRIVVNNRKKLMMLGVVAGLGGVLKAVDAMPPTERAPENTAIDADVASITFDVHSQVCGQGIDDCYVDTGKGLEKISQK